MRPNWAATSSFVGFAGGNLISSSIHLSHIFDLARAENLLQVRGGITGKGSVDAGVFEIGRCLKQCLDDERHSGVRL